MGSGRLGEVLAHGGSTVARNRKQNKIERSVI